MFPYQTLKRNAAPALVFLLIALVVITDIMTAHTGMLKNQTSPSAILRVEIGRNQDTLEKIVQLWRVDTLHSIYYDPTSGLKDPDQYVGIDVARNATYADFVFIVCYVLFLSLVCILLAPARKRARWVKWLSALAVLAGIMDCMEDVSILRALHNTQTPVWSIWIPSYIKWFLVGCLSLFILIRLIAAGLFMRGLRTACEKFVSLLAILWRFRIVVISLILIFVVLWVMDQGQDLLLVINSSPKGPSMLLVVVTVLALLNWHLPKYYSSKHIKNLQKFSIGTFFWGDVSFNDVLRNEEEKFLARLLGCLSFLLPMTCLLHAMHIFSIPYLIDYISPMVLLIAIMASYYFLLKYRVIDRFFAPGGSFNEVRFWSVLALIVTVIISLGFIPGNGEQNFLPYFALDLFLLSFLFLVATTVRTCVGTNSPLGKLKIVPWVMIPGLIITVIFLVCNLMPENLAFNDSSRFLTLPVVFSAFVFYSVIFSILLLIGIRYRVQFITLLLLVIFLFSALRQNSYHQVQMVHKDTTSVENPDLGTYISGWLDSRRHEIDSFNNDSGGRQYPVFIVNAYGGGIRAAVWTTLVVGELENQIRKTYTGQTSFKNDFEHYVIAYSGASGGTIGSSVLCAARYADLRSGRHDSLSERCEALYKNDFLTPDMTGLLGRDIWLSPWGFKGHDRAYYQERNWETHMHAAGFDYSKPFPDYWFDPATKYEIPLLFANSYDLDSGLKAIVAPVRLNERQFPGTVFIRDLLPPDKDLKLSTAAFLSARFPYISPTAKIDDQHHFMDGGLKENSGAETAREIMTVFDSVLSQKQAVDTVYKKVKVFVLSLPNSIGKTDSLEKAKNVFELSAPLTALLNNWIGNTTKAETINAMGARSNRYWYGQIKPKPVKAAHDVTPVLPLGWQISDAAIEEMKRSLQTRNKSELRNVINVISPQ